MGLAVGLLSFGVTCFFLVYLARHRERKAAKARQREHARARQKARDDEAIAKALGHLGGSHHALTPEEREAERIRRNVLGSLGSTSFSSPKDWEQHKVDKAAANITEADRILAAAEDFAELEEAFEEGEISAQEFKFLLDQLMAQGAGGTLSGGAEQVTDFITSTMDRTDLKPLMTEEEEAEMEMALIMKRAQEAENARKKLEAMMNKSKAKEEGEGEEEEDSGDEDEDSDEDEDEDALPPECPSRFCRTLF